MQSLDNGVSTTNSGLFDAKALYVKQQCCYFTHSWKDIGIFTRLQMILVQTLIK